MEKYIENAIKLEKFSKEIFEKLGMICNDYKGYDRSVDFFIRIDNKEYGIEVKRKVSPISISHIINKMKEDDSYQKILMIYDNVTENVRKIIEDTNIILLDISNILYIVYKDTELLKKLTGFLEYSLEAIVPKENKLKLQIEENLERIYQDDRILEKTQEYRNRLSNLKKGKSNYKDYERLIGEILREIFCDNLEFKEQNATSNRLNIFDMIAKIKNGSTDDFFKTIEEFFESKYIVFEFKNYSEKITQEQVCTTEKYLYGTALRKVGIIITRKGIDNNGKKVAEGILRESGKLIIVLDDDDINKMLCLYDTKETPSNVLMEKLDEILTKLER